MRYLLCFVFPPAAVLITGRPVSAILNVFLTLLLWVPGVVHALVVTMQHERARQHAETLSAITGEDIQPPPTQEWALLAGLVLAFGVLATGGHWYFTQGAGQAWVALAKARYREAELAARAQVSAAEEEVKKQRARPASGTTPPVEGVADESRTEVVPMIGGEERQQRNFTAMAALGGKTLEEMARMHGPPLEKDKTTGWALWAKFRARFDQGKVVQVEMF